jgi:hypothetical protein
MKSWQTMKRLQLQDDNFNRRSGRGTVSFQTQNILALLGM